MIDANIRRVNAGKDAISCNNVLPETKPPTGLYSERVSRNDSRDLSHDHYLGRVIQTSRYLIFSLPKHLYNNIFISFILLDNNEIEICCYRTYTLVETHT